MSDRYDDRYDDRSRRDDRDDYSRRDDCSRRRDDDDDRYYERRDRGYDRDRGYGRPSSPSVAGGGNTVDCVGDCTTGRGYCYARSYQGERICANCVLWDPVGSEVLWPCLMTVKIFLCLASRTWIRVRR